MKHLLLLLMLVISLLPARAQINLSNTAPLPSPGIDSSLLKLSPIKIDRTKKWKMDRNKWITGSLLFTAGAAKGFNEILHFHYRGFAKIFPNANAQWFYPPFSFKNKYKDGDPSKGPKFPFSTSLLVMFTDQYHLNNFIQRSAMTAALVIKIGEGKKPFRHYVFDVMYYTFCYQLGFNSLYLPMKTK